MYIMKSEKTERLLIHVDKDLAKYNQEVLKAIFEEVKTMRARFNEIEVLFNQPNFLKTIMGGCNWIEQTLYDKLAENYKGMSERVIQTLTEDKKGKLKMLVVPFEPLVTKVKELLKKIDLTPDQVPFDTENNPAITNELKHFLSEKSRRYITTDEEKELYYTILKFIESTNALEASLAKNGFPLLFTKYLDFQLPMPNAENDTFAYPLALANYDNVLIDNHAILELNPEYFEDIRAIMKALSDRQNLEREMRSLPPEVRFHENRGIDIPAATFKLKPDASKKIESGIKTPSRWKGMPGVD
jgi:hypothetical protein